MAGSCLPKAQRWAREPEEAPEVENLETEKSQDILNKLKKNLVGKLEASRATVLSSALSLSLLPNNDHRE